MRFALNSDHKDFYSKNSFIEFDELLTPDSLASLQSDIETTLSHRLKIPSSRLHEQPLKALFDAGFDIWRDSSTFKKTLFKSTVSEIAAQLFEESFLRIGFDQYIDTASGSSPLLTSSLSLNDLSCAKPLMGPSSSAYPPQSTNRSILKYAQFPPRQEAASLSLQAKSFRGTPYLPRKTYAS